VSKVLDFRFTKNIMVPKVNVYHTLPLFTAGIYALMLKDLAIDDPTVILVLLYRVSRFMKINSRFMEVSCY